MQVTEVKAMQRYSLLVLKNTNTLFGGDLKYLNTLKGRKC